MTETPTVMLSGALGRLEGSRLMLGGDLGVKPNHHRAFAQDPIGLIAELQRENAELKAKLAASEQSDAASMRALIEVTREKEMYRLAAAAR